MSEKGHPPPHHWSAGKSNPSTLAECAEIAAKRAKELAPAIARAREHEAARLNYDPKPAEEQAREIAKGRDR